MEISQTHNSHNIVRKENNTNENTSTKKNNYPKIDCKIKLSGFHPYENIGTIPQKFRELVKIISKYVFPKNFSLNYFSEDYSTIPISNSKDYKSLLRFCVNNRLNEIKFFIITHEDSSLEKNALSQEDAEIEEVEIEEEENEGENSNNSSHIFSKFNSYKLKSFKRNYCRSKKILRDRRINRGIRSDRNGIYCC